MKERFVTTLPPDTIIKLKILAAERKQNVNDVIENLVKKEEREERDR